MSQNGQTHFCRKIFKVCLTILRHYTLKSQHRVNTVFEKNLKITGVAAQSLS